MDVSSSFPNHTNHNALPRLPWTEEWLAKCGLKRNPCSNEGYLGPKCTCVCPPGSAGRTCSTEEAGYYGR